MEEKAGTLTKRRKLSHDWNDHQEDMISVVEFPQMLLCDALHNFR